MRVLVATDAWHPQVNGVVRTLTALQASARRLGVDVRFLSPEGFFTVPLPSYPGIRLAIPDRREVRRRIEACRPDAIHIATEGPIGLAVRSYCIRRGLPFTTSYSTKFPEYISTRFLVPESLSYGLLRRFHSASRVTMASTASLVRELRQRGFRRLGLWTRGVDTDLFAPWPRAALDLPRPIFMNMGRIAIEKNLEAFLSLDLPGSKVVIGEGPQMAELQRRFPDVHFLGMLRGQELASHLAAADVFVFPSKTDTYGLVQLEALSCGVPVAAFPVTGPRDVIGDSKVGALDDDLRAACLGALRLSRDACRDAALAFSWDKSAQQFVRHVSRALISEGQRRFDGPLDSSRAA
jgi:glycosyltransferase involved in cell wall biosynthesis